MKSVSNIFADYLEPEQEITVSEWADQHRYLSGKSSAEPGRWRTERTPYLREIMDELSPRSSTQRVVFMAGAQVGKTEAGNNWLGAIIDQFPGPVLAIQPTVDIAMRFSKQRVATLIDESPRLRDKVRPPRSRDSGNTLFSKEFPGGVLMITGSNSAAGLRSMPIKYLFADEVDAYPYDVEGEGDPLSLAERRTITFARRKLFICSTPTLRNQSRIEREFLQTDQRRFYVPCPHCSGTQYLQWQYLVWENRDPSTARYKCEHCNALIEERYKTQMLSAGRWLPTAHAMSPAIVGFHLNSLYSPLGWKSWADIVAEFLRVKTDAPSLKTWVNTILGETFEEDYVAKLGATGLAERAEFYDPDIVPDGAVIVTVGVDVQDNRLAILFVAWGDGEQAWVLNHMEIYGDPSSPLLWKQLDDTVLTPLTWHNGHKRCPDVIAIDSGGHFTHEAYQYARERKLQNVIAVKGLSVRNRPPIGKPSKCDVNIRGQVLKRGGVVYPVGTDTIKSTLYGRLTHNTPGAGYVHFNTKLTPEFYQQLTSEKKTIRYVKGFPVYEWTKSPSIRNEALDCLVYAYAGFNLLYQRYNKSTIFTQFAKTCGTITDRAKIVSIDTVATPARRTRRPQQPNNSFVNNW